MEPETNENLRSEVFSKKVSRRRAIGTAAKVSIAAGVAALIAGTGGYLGGASTVPPIREKTVTVTSPAPGGPATTVTSTVTQTVQSPITVERTVTITQTPIRAKFIKGGKLRILDIQTLQPSLDFHFQLGAEHLLSDVNLKLTDFDDNYNLGPQLAERWETPDGGKTWIFYLKKGVKVHDGHQFTAEDVKFNFDRLAALGAKKSFYPALKGAEIVDSFTVKILNDKPINLPSIAATDRGGMLLPKLPKEVLDPKGDDPWGKKFFEKNLVGTGPFKLVEHKSFEVDRMVKFEGYWEKDAEGNQLPYLDEVERIAQTDAVARYNTGKAGGYHLVTGVQADFWSEVRASRDFNLVTVFSNNYPTIYFNMTLKDSPIKDIRIRKAIAHATNREELINLAVGGNGEPAYMFFSKKNPYYHKPIEQMIPEYSLEKAKQLLTEAGYPNGIDLNMMSAAAWGDTITKPFGQILAKANIRLKLEILDPPAYVKRSAEKAWEMQGGGSGDKTDMVVMWAGSQFGNSFYADVNAEAGSLVKELTTSVEEAKLKEVVKQLQIVVARDIPQLTLYTFTSSVMASKKVEGARVRLAHDNAFAAQPSLKTMRFLEG